jgi:hypothetical protein
MRRTILALAALLASSCTSSRNYAQAIVALVDVSGTYVDQKAEVVNIIRRGILPKLNPGDSLFVIRIDGESYKRTNLEGGITLDVRPSRANAQKLAFATQLDKFANRTDHAKYTDIRGAMMLGAEYLKETGAGNRTMIVFSDLEEDLPKGVTRNLSPDEFAGMRIVAMNVKKLAGDNRNPTGYRERLASWKKQAVSHGARDFQVFLEPEKLEQLLDEAR